MTSLKSEAESAQKAAKILLDGKIAVLPTDTVYGFSALAISRAEGTEGTRKSGLDLKIDQIKKAPNQSP